MSKKLQNITINVVVCFLYAGSILFPFLSTPAAAEKKSLWKIQSKNNVVYLLGSIHYLKPQAYPLDPVLEDAFKNSKKLVLEIQLESLDRGGQQVMLMKGLFTDGRTLKSVVAEETYKLAESELNKLGLEINVFNQFKPWFVALAVTALKLERLGFDPSHGIDRYFYQKAKKESKEILGLETVEYQMDLFDGMEAPTQELLLLSTLKDLASMEQSVDAVVHAWAAGDLNALDSTLLQSLRAHPQVYQRLIVDRNRAWIPKIESYLTEREKYLVVVGAGHLAGKDGIIEVMKRKGYSVEQL